MIEREHRRLIHLKPNLERRALIYHLTRAFFRKRGFLEIETPIHVPTIAPELYIVPFQSEGWFLSTSPELYMKRLLAAGYKRIFQMSRCFRKGERGRQHNPEFTMLEWYRANANYMQMIDDAEQLVVTLVSSLKLGSTIKYRDQSIDISLPWSRTTVHDSFLNAAGWDPLLNPDPMRFDTDLVVKVIPSFSLCRPTVLTDYPANMASLALLKPGAPEIAERAEVFLGGLELANAYSELRNKVEQEKRFQEEICQIQKYRGQSITMPRQFLDAVGYLPECGGIALGMDRLVMLLCNADSIDEVIAFTIDQA